MYFQVLIGFHVRRFTSHGIREKVYYLLQALISKTKEEPFKLR